MPVKKRKPSEAASINFQFSDGATYATSVVDHLLTHIRQWVLIERLPVSTDEEYLCRERVSAKLRNVASLAIDGGFNLMAVTEGGRKGGKSGVASKAAIVLQEAAKRREITPAVIQVIANKTGVSKRTVRDTLKSAGRYVPQKKKGK